MMADKCRCGCGEYVRTRGRRLLPGHRFTVPKWAEPLSSFLQAQELEAIRLLQRELDMDATKTFQFWESVVSRIVDGTTTDHRCRWDVELIQGDALIRIEVKFSQEFACRFNNGTRHVFKWAVPKGGRPTEKPSHVTTMIGVDNVDLIHMWVVPSAYIPQCKSITVTSPRDRTGGISKNNMDDWYCPPSQLLPEVLRSYRLHIGEER